MASRRWSHHLVDQFLSLLRSARERGCGDRWDRRARVEHACRDQPVHRPRRIGRMHTYSARYHPEVGRSLRLATTTRTRNCGSVTTSSTATTDRALTATSTRARRRPPHVVVHATLYSC